MVGLGTRAAMELIDEGRFTQIAPGLTVYVGRKRGDVIENVRIYDGRDPRIKRAIDARSGVLRRRPGGADLEIDLLDVRVDPIAPETPGSASCQRWSLKVENAFAVREYQKKEADFLFGELVDRIRDTARYFPQLSPRDLAIERMTLRVELNSRFSLALSCLTFVLLGVPLGIRSHRKESSVGVAISIGLTFAFYICILLAEEMVKYPAVRPDLIAWLPVAASVALGAWLIHRAN
jgi:lipopolysaccharide export system permease protein